MKVDMLIKEAMVFNSYFKQFTKANVAVKDGKFFYIGAKGSETFTAEKIIEAAGMYLVPGLIDIHLHIESTMVTPATFSYGLLKNGVTTIVPEPHEMANVFGIAGVKEMIKASKNCRLDMFYAIPSSVPATSMETTGGAIEIEDIEELLQTERIKCLGEIMNYYDVISKPGGKTNKILSYMSENYPELIIEGHVPKLLDLELQSLAFAGVTSDHTHQTVAGMKERIAIGMFLEIQEKSMTKEVIDYLIDQDVDEHFCFVTDDVMADSLQNRGHLNVLLKKAIAMGMSPEKAIYACTYTPAARMRMYDRGVIAPGKLADFLLISELESFHIQEVYKEGTKVYDETIPYVQEESSQAFPSSFYESVNLNKLDEDAFQVKLMKNDGKVKCRIMNVKNGSTFTEEKHDDLNIEAGMLQWEESEYGLLATFERYGKNGNSARGLIGGDVLKRGAVATTYSHDNHNLLVLGQNKEDMVIAANEVIKQQGGICCVHNGEILANVPLPVGGILSEEPLSIISKQVEQLTATLQALGYEHYNAIMSLSTLSLPVSPALKITDHGLIDVNKGMVVPLVVK
ncbi:MULTISPECIES: adenine deaminase C-terminal domain-containing protein [Bacillaceae]|uniref:adenine deaminase C-terminal domain-containing protein n=1 Tax=Bacillaceae TaxID=186817 RepID=UPI001E2CA490|nr:MULTISPECIES: adenine deaminase C-terminal domain-containing protein [Bacillaceae]MCE4050545.1 amidohydrolase family protein [Bacillus sp. Au-Bac7]UPO88518.1 amidohydrolase family protein [Niallia sp. Man26]